MHPNQMRPTVADPVATLPRMRRLTALTALVAMSLTSCATITDNVSIEVDVKGLVASTCQQLASGFADQLVEAVAELDAGTDVALPDIDVRALIDRADDLGCSPDDLQTLVTEKLGEIDAVSAPARQLLDQVSGQLDEAPTG